MFDKFLQDFEKNLKNADRKLTVKEQLRRLSEGKIDRVRINGEVAMLKPADATMLLRAKKIDERMTATDLTKAVAAVRDENRRQALAEKRRIEESESAMFDLIQNLKYLPGIEKVVSANGT